MTRSPRRLPREEHRAGFQGVERQSVLVPPGEYPLQGLIHNVSFRHFHLFGCGFGHQQYIITCNKDGTLLHIQHCLCLLALIPGVEY